jgi:hypothetical protein
VVSGNSLEPSNFVNEVCSNPQGKLNLAESFPMRIGILVVCDARVDVKTVMSLAGVLLAHKGEIEFVRAICLHPLGAQYWDALATSPLFSDWVEPAVLAATSDNAVEALASCAGGNDSVATIVLPLVDISYEDVLELGMQMRHGIRHLSAQFPIAQSADGEICVNVHIFVGVWGLCGFDIQPISDSIGLMDCLTDAITERQKTIRATANSSQLINGVYSHGGDSLSPGMAVELTVIVPTLDANSQRFRRLYRSLYDSTDVPFQLVIVDNGKSAQGFTEPVNAGIRACTTRYAVVVNDDVTFASGWWSPLCAALESGSWVVFPMTDGNTRADFSAWCFAIDLDHFDEYAHSEHELFDPQLRIWFQDSDLYLKLLDAEHPPKLVEESHISHELSATVNTRDAMLSQWIYDVIIDDKAHFVERWGLQGLERVGFACDETNQVRYLEESSGS